MCNNKWVTNGRTSHLCTIDLQLSSLRHYGWRARELLIHDMIKMFENPVKGLIFEELIKMHNLHASSPCVRVVGRATHDYQSKDQNTCTWYTRYLLAKKKVQILNVASRISCFWVLKAHQGQLLVPRGRSIGRQKLFRKKRKDSYYYTFESSQFSWEH